MKKIILCFSLIAMFSAGAAFGDNIRGPVQAVLDLSASAAGYRGQLGIEEILAVISAPDPRFYRAVEFSVELPPAVREYGDAFALYLYRHVSPAPAEGFGAFRGNRIILEPFRFRRKLFVQLPLTSDSVRKASPDTLVFSGSVSGEQYPLLLTVLPVMKGLPSAASAAGFPVAVRLIPNGMGAIAISVKTADGNTPENLKVLLNETQLSDPAEEQLLKPGIYGLTVTADGYRPSRSSVTVEEARITGAGIDLFPSVCSVVFEAPKDAVIYLDGEKISSTAQESITVSEGPHSLIMKMGDYQITRKFTAQAGKIYRISLFLDIFIEEH